jgi:hypothetical protein
MNWIIAPRMIVMPFAFAQWIIVWSLRFSPPRSSISALSKGILTLALCSALLAGILGEVLLYRSLTGRDSLRGDYFFYTVLIVQSIVGMAILFKSDSVVRRKERGAA